MTTAPSFDLTTPAMQRAAEVAELTRVLRFRTPSFLEQASKLAQAMAAAAAASPEAAAAIKAALESSR
jgi:hypothetical protein